MNGKPLLKEKDKPKKKRTKSEATLKKELDAVYSKYIRQFYSVDGQVACYTCYKVKPISEMQCGHFVSRKHTATRWDERNTRPQCWGCNSKNLGNGMPVVFAGRLCEEYGDTIVGELYRKAREIVKNYPYKEKIEYYKNLVKQNSTK